MNFDNQGIVSGKSMKQNSVLLLVYRAVNFTEAYYKMHCITIGSVTPPQKILKLCKNKS